jgi:hypothetical protein
MRYLPGPSVRDGVITFQDFTSSYRRTARSRPHLVVVLEDFDGLDGLTCASRQSSGVRDLFGILPTVGGERRSDSAGSVAPESLQ